MGWSHFWEHHTPILHVLIAEVSNVRLVRSRNLKTSFQKKDLCPCSRGRCDTSWIWLSQTKSQETRGNQNSSLTRAFTWANQNPLNFRMRTKNKNGSFCDAADNTTKLHSIVPAPRWISGWTLSFKVWCGRKTLPESYVYTSPAHYIIPKDRGWVSLILCKWQSWINAGNECWLAEQHKSCLVMVPVFSRIECNGRSIKSGRFVQ